MIRLLTWNMQGYKNASYRLYRFLNSGRYDVLCLQEAGGNVLGRFGYNKRVNMTKTLDVYNLSDNKPINPFLNRLRNRPYTEYAAFHYVFGFNKYYRCSMTTYV